LGAALDGTPQGSLKGRRLVRGEREPVDFLARVHDPADHAREREHTSSYHENQAGGNAHDRQRDSGCGQQRQDRRPRKMDLLASGRNLWIEWAHETYTAATTNVRPNMNIQI